MIIATKRIRVQSHVPLLGHILPPVYLMNSSGQIIPNVSKIHRFHPMWSMGTSVWSTAHNAQLNKQTNKQ